MIASPASRARAPLAGLAALLAAGCATPAGAPPRSAFLPPVESAPPAPDVADRTAADLARAALLSDREQAERAVHRMRAIETILGAAEEPRTGLLGAALDLRNTTLDDHRAYRAASRELLARGDLDPALRRRLELFRDDAPLALAGDRLRDAWLLEFGRAFNALVEPVGRSILSQPLAPYRLARSLVRYATETYTREALVLQKRQALAHWQEFVARHPEADEARELVPRIREAGARLARTRRDRAVRVASRALEEDRIRLALVYADRALRAMPEDGAASRLHDEAARRLLAIRSAQRESLGAAPGDPSLASPRARDLAHALLAPAGDALGAADRLLAAEPDGPLADEARFARALALREAGDEEAHWKALERLAHEDPRESNMARHAAALVGSPEQNPRGAWLAARRSGRWQKLRWVLVGPFFRGPRDQGLPGPLEWILDAPSLAESVFGAPFRLVNLPWTRGLPAERVAAVYARQRLVREPDAPLSGDVRDWLEAYERGRGNYAAAHAVAEGRHDVPPEELAALREKAAAQYVRAALRERSLALRIGMLNQVAISYPGSRAARVAGDLARREVRGATAQRIRLSRGFLLENPEVAGARGLALRPELLDGDAGNAELHPEGVTLVGGRAVELHYLAPSGDEDDPPVDVREAVDEGHLARIVSRVEESTFRKSLLDSDAVLRPDAQRDLFFERARLGLAEQVDRRPAAVSTHAYRGLREQYGLVRRREPILPFDLVLQGSFDGLSLGAFPRMRPPKQTPDAMLYR